MHGTTRSSDGPGIAPVIYIILGLDALILGLIVGVVASPWIGLVAGAAALAAPVMIAAPLLALISLFSGWSALAQACPARPCAELYRRGGGASIAMRRRWMGYGNCITWAADAACLHLSVMRPFNAMTPGLSIPWPELDFDESLPGKGVAVCETVAGVRLWLPRTMLEEEAARRRGAARVNP
jgi:hypothetical protein